MIFVAVPGLLGDQVEDDQAQVAMGEEAAEPASAAQPVVPKMAEMWAVLAVFVAAVATAVVVTECRWNMGSPNRHNVLSDISEYAQGLSEGGNPW